MTSIEAFKNIKTLSYCKQHITIQEWCNIIEQDLDRLEKLESELKRKSGIICMLESENESLEAKFDAYYELHKQLEKGYDDLSVDNDKLIQENRKLKKVIEILKDKLELPLEDDFDVVNKDDVHLYRLRTKCLINEEEYEILKEVLKYD